MSVCRRPLIRFTVTRPSRRSRSCQVTPNVSPGLQPTHAPNSTHAWATCPYPSGPHRSSAIPASVVTSASVSGAISRRSSDCFARRFANGFAGASSSSTASLNIADTVFARCRFAFAHRKASRRVIASRALSPWSSRNRRRLSR